jgi:hypothetical protein
LHHFHAPCRTHNVRALEMFLARGTARSGCSSKRRQPCRSLTLLKRSRAASRCEVTGSAAIADGRTMAFVTGCQCHWPISDQPFLILRRAATSQAARRERNLRTAESTTRGVQRYVVLDRPPSIRPRAKTRYSSKVVWTLIASIR